ncbi:hypothetical protein J0X19_20720 [Hymenobacter sp. BT186]|uniref:Uncharacterized protein n=1 Tax=Hymenobacter telluris TaxID=2816474 RepID=A0A939F144_9BACT|nr:hypothetical protein [Hymenobacter telluris]MBO0360397.1 hypothetical protein [Hymenobacter telluris]MBW3376424.1 hypothetical protein [Hymenobacter norwichensis]
MPIAFAVGLALTLASAAQAQTPARVATRVDSLRAARYGTPSSVPAVFTFTTGKQVPAFLAYDLPLPTCFLDQVACYETSPERIPPPPAKALSVERLKGMSVNGHHYEALYLKGKPLGLLAENLVAAGPVELFGYAKTKNDMLVPIPLPVGALIVSTGTHDKYYWYVRTQGGPLLEVPRGDNEFAKVMSAYFGANTALSARIQLKEKGARFNDMVELANTFNGQPVMK